MSVTLAVVAVMDRVHVSWLGSSPTIIGVMTLLRTLWLVGAPDYSRVWYVGPWTEAQRAPSRAQRRELLVAEDAKPFDDRPHDEQHRERIDDSALRRGHTTTGSKTPRSV